MAARAITGVGWVVLAGCLSISPVLATSLPSLICRADVIVDCEASCTFQEGNAEIAIDAAAKTLSYCRGEGCDEGQYVETARTGQLNGDDYRPVAGRGSVSSLDILIDLSNGTFHARCDVGSLAGRCAKPE